MSLMLSKDEAAVRIAKNVAHLFNSVEDTFVLNLGVGIPTQVSDYVDNENIYIHAENGMIGVGSLAKNGGGHPKLINASRQPVMETPGCVYIDSCMAFGMIRGGRVDATVLGAFQVDEQANVANWIIPNGKQLGVGGAMDLVVGAKTVVIAMMHTNKGKIKLVKSCTLPVTGYGEVDIIVTEMAVFFFEKGRFILKKIAPDVTLDEIRGATDFSYDLADQLESMLV